jgi:hypothetical protein
MGPDNRIDRAGTAAVRATDTKRFVNNGNTRFDRFGEWNDLPTE